MHRYSARYRFGIHHVPDKIEEVFNRRGIPLKYEQYTMLRQIYRWEDGSERKIDMIFQFKKLEVVIHYYEGKKESTYVLHNPDLAEIVNTVNWLIEEGG